MSKLLSMENKNFHRVKTYSEYEKTLNQADFLAYLDTYAWLLAMSDLLFFADARIKDSDYYKAP